MSEAEELYAEIEGGEQAAIGWDARIGGVSTLEELLDLRVIVRDFAAAARQLAATLDAEIAESVEGTLDVGRWTVKRRWQPSSTKWDMEALTDTLVERAMETGEDPLLCLRECVSFGYGRVSALREHGLNPDLYREQSSTGKWTVQVTEAVDER